MDLISFIWQIFLSEDLFFKYKDCFVFPFVVFDIHRP